MPVRAAPDEAPTVLTPRAIADMSLDDLFAKLPENAESPTGQRIERELLRRFTRSGSPTADLLLGWAMDAMEKKDYPQALDLLDQIVILKPDFAEAWNRRATVYFLLDDFSASLSDLRQALTIEPRHFGALAGLGIIMQQLGRDTEAEAAYRRALAIDPFLEKVKESLERLEKADANRDI